MPLALALGGLGREAAKVAAGLALLLLLALAAMLSLLGALVSPLPAGAPLPSGTGRIGLPAPSGAALPPPKLGDTRWGVGTDTYCELYVEQRFHLGNQGATAYQAYLRLDALGLVHHAAPDGPDELVYFGPSGDNEGDGHVGAYAGGGLFDSITTYGLQREPLAGWRAPYLGWVHPADIRTDRFDNAVSPIA